MFVESKSDWKAEHSSECAAHVPHVPTIAVVVAGHAGNAAEPPSAAGAIAAVIHVGRGAPSASCVVFAAPHGSEIGGSIPPAAAIAAAASLAARAASAAERPTAARREAPSVAFASARRRVPSVHGLGCAPQSAVAIEPAPESAPTDCTSAAALPSSEPQSRLDERNS